MVTRFLKNRFFQFGLVCAVGAASFFVWDSFFRGSKLLRSNPVLKKDYQILQNEKPDTPVGSLTTALHRLNSYRLPEGIQEALKREKDPRPEIRGAVAEALAMNVLRGEVLEAEERLLADPDEAVRVASLTALTRIGDPKRIEMFQQAMSNPKKSVREEFLILSGLVSTSRGAEKESHLKSIHALINQHKIDSDLAAYGLKTLLRMAAMDPVSIQYIEAAFLDPKTSKDLIPALYRHLVRARPDFLRKRFQQDVRSSFVALRVTALNSILEICPPERWDMIQWVAREPNMDSQSKVIVKRIASYLGGKVDADGNIQVVSPGTDRCALARSKGSILPRSGK